MASFGEAENQKMNAADVLLERVQLTGDTTVIQASADGETLLFKINASGRHFAMNALGALAAVRAIGRVPELAIANGGGGKFPQQMQALLCAGQ